MSDTSSLTGSTLASAICLPWQLSLVLQVLAGKTYYVSLNGANYDDTFDLSIQIVPDIVDNPFVQASVATHLSCSVIQKFCA